MLHRLAWQFGEPDVMELDRNMTDKALTYWAAFLRVWPSGEDAMDARFAVLRSDLYMAMENICFSIYRAQGGKPRKPRAHPPRELMPLLRGEQKAKRTFNDMTQEEIAARMRIYATDMEAAHSGSDT